jgi:hypothetical protein
MANNFSQNHTPNVLGGVELTVGGFVDVTGPPIGTKGLWGDFTASTQIEEGDYLMDRSRDLLRRHLQMIEVHDQDTIRERIDKVRDIKMGLENVSGSRFERLREARKYRRHSKVTYKTIKDASGRAIDDLLRNQMAIRPPGGGSGSGPGTGSVVSIPRNQFTDSHAISTLTNVDFNNLDQVDVSTFQAGDTGAVVLDLVAQDKSVQHVVATFPTEIFSDDRADRGAPQSIAPEAPAALSLHQEDGTMLRFIAASLHDQRANEDVDTRTLASIAATEIFGTSEGSDSSLVATA